MQTSREAAFEALRRCRRDSAWSGASIDKAIRTNGLSERDAALASRIALGVMQNGELLDFYISAFCSSKLEPQLRDILRIGVYQLCLMDKIPARAAVNETVALCKKLGYSRASGLVNAVLRRVSENRDKLPEIPGRGTASYLSIRYSHPEWLCERIICEHDYDFAEAFLRANNDSPGLYIQVNTLKISSADYMQLLDERGIAYKSGDIDGLLRLEGGRVPQLPGFDAGLFYVQDKAARAAAEIAGAKSGMRVLDACAAPGGKSLASAIKMGNKGEIVACDIHEKKLGLIRDSAARLGIDIITTRAADARKYDESLGEFELVIADVPCSGLGVIRKKPEIRCKSEAELARLPEIQSEILQNLSRYVKPGGCLLYSTCTVLKCENEDVVNAFLDGREDFEPSPFAGAESGMYGFWPQKDDSDGFFAAKLRKKH